MPPQSFHKKNKMKEISAIAVVTLRAIGAAYRHLQLPRHLFLRTNEGRPPMSRLRSLKALLIISSVTAAGRQQNEPSLPRFSDLEATVVSSRRTISTRAICLWRAARLGPR